MAGVLTPTAFGQSPVPEQSAQNQALALVAEVYKADYDRAKTPAQRRALAERMLADVPAATDPANRFALLRVARDVAAEAGAADLAIRAVDQLASGYRVDAMEMKLAVLKTLARSSTQTDQQRALAEVAIKVVDEAFTEDDFEAATQAGRIAVTAARRGQNAELANRIVARNREIEKLQRTFRRVEAARQVLDQKPTDPEANLTVGRYLCFVKGDWQRGVPMLALGSEKPLADLAVRELEGVSTPGEQAALGDDWWELAEKASDDEKSPLRERARHWYALALPQLSGLVRQKVEKRMVPSEGESSPAGKHYLEPATIGKVVFMNYLGPSQKVDARDLFSVQKAGAGYRVSCGGGGAVSKWMLFPKEDVRTKKLVVTWTIQKGAGFVGFRSQALEANGPAVEFRPGKQHHVELWIENGLARCVADGEPAPIARNNPAHYGVFCITLLNHSTVQIYELRFDDLK